MNATPTERQGLEAFFAKSGVTLSKRSAATSPTPTSAGSMGVVNIGGRNNEIARLAGQLIREGKSLAAVMHQAQHANKKFSPPLDETEVATTCESIWRTNERNSQEGGSDPLLPLFDISDARIDRFLSTPAPLRRWVMQDFIPLGIVAAIISPGGMGKSQFLMQVAYSVATGVPLAGHWQVGEVGAVLMLCAEDDPDEIHRRVRRIHAQLSGGLNSATRTELINRLHIKSLVAEDVQLTSVRYGNEATKTEVCARLELTVQQLHNVKLIIIDPASRFRGGEENSNAHATRFVSALEGLAKATGATVLIAHHSNKASAYVAEASQNSSRGASGFTDGIRLQFSLTSIAKTKGYEAIAPNDRQNYLELSVVKSNYTAPQIPVLLHREADGYILASSAQGNGNPQREAKATIALLHVIAQLRIKATARHIEQNYCGPNKQIEISQKEFRELVDAAHAKSLVVKAPRRPLTLTVDGRNLMAANPIVVGAAGAARRNRTPRKSAIKSTS